MIKFRLFFGFILLFMLIVFSSCIFNPPLPDVCVDGDGDGFGVNCDSGLDCDDSNANVYEEISCSYDGSVCGAFSLCLDSCPVPPAEICGNDVDEDCNGEDLDCPVVTGDAWYVDNSATGNGDGTSWVDAATSLVALDWSQISGGHTIYMSGGSTSKTYDKQILVNKIISDGIVTITKGIDAGHNGEVIIQQSGIPSGEKASFKLKNCENIKVSSLTITSNVPDTYYGEYIFSATDGKNNIVDNCKIISKGNGYGIGTVREDKITISNNHIETIYNELDYGQDPIIMAVGDGGHKIINNTLIHRGDNPAQHNDVIQVAGGEGGTTKDEFIIANNFLYYPASPAGLGTQLMYLSDLGSNNFLIENNVLVGTIAGNDGIIITTPGTSYDITARIYNNTIATDDPGDFGIVIDEIDEVDIKDNVVYSEGGSGNFINFIGSINDLDSVVIDNNQYYEPNFGRHFNGNSWSDWQALGYDVHGKIEEPCFKNLWGDSKDDYEVVECFVETGDAWYVSTTTSGTGSADSWANKKALSSFSWSQVQPGDTVYIDGGSNGLTYNYAFRPMVSGTSSKRITITRGIDAGHNGVPLFIGNLNSAAGTISTSYLNVNALGFSEGDGPTGGTLVLGTSAHDIDLTNCSVHFTITRGIHLWGASNVKIMNCNLYTGKINYDAPTDGIWIGNGGSNVEIAYNSIILENSDQNPPNHKDIIQAYQWQLDGGITKIHHNFFYHVAPGANDTAGVYLNHIGGEFQVYDNVIVLAGNRGTSLNFVAQDYASGNPSIKFQAYVYNNVFHYMDIQQGVKFYGADKASFKNNIIYLPEHDYSTPIILALSGGTEYLSYPDLDFDYNQYRVPGSSAPNGLVYLHEGVSAPDRYSWSEWQALGHDVHSEIFTSGSDIVFAGSVPSTDVADYRLMSGSTGVDEGISVNLLNDDYSGAFRPQGSGWDVGAFER